MAENYTVGIDFGTLSCRAVLVRVSDGAELTDAVFDYPHAVMDEFLAYDGSPLPPDFALQDPSDYLAALRFVLPEVLKKSGVSPDRIVGVGVDFTCCTLVPVKSDGTPLCFLEKYKSNPHAYVKLWKHHAAQPYADRLNAIAAERGEGWLEEYGGKLSCEWYFPKVWEILDKAPEIYADADYFIEAGEWVTWYLTGKLTRSYVFAASKTIYNKCDGGYPSPDFFAALDERLRNVVAEKLNIPMVYSGCAAGRICLLASAETGLSTETVVSAPLPDAHVATVALDMKNSGDLCAIMGTSSCYMLIGDDYSFVPGICGIHKDSLTPGFWGYEAGLCCVGDLFAWAAENIAPAEYKAEAVKRGMSVLKLLVEKASKLKPGEAGLVALDWWNGNRNILSDTSLSGALFGLTLATKAEHIFRSLIEATAFATRVLLENYKSHGIEIKRFIAAGGIARKDPFTMQLYADVLGLDILIAGSSQIPALASSIYAASAAGYDLNDSISRMSKLSDTVYRPDPSATKIYDRLYAEYLTLHDFFGRGGNDVLKRLRKLRTEVEQ